MDFSTLTGLPLSNPETYTSVVAGLSVFGANGARNYINGLMEFLALYAIKDLGSRVYGISLILQRLEILVGFRVDVELLLAALRRLEEAGKVSVVHGEHEETAQFGLLNRDKKTGEDIRQRLETEEETYRQFEKTVFSSWLEDVGSRRPELTDIDREHLLQDLKTFSARLYSHHSLPTVALYFEDNERMNMLLDKMNADELPDILPYEDRSTELLKVRNIEIANFFLNANDERHRYIGRQFSPMFALHMMYLDPKCADLLTQHITGGKLYLDTNFLFRLFGLQGAGPLKDSAKKLIELSKKIGYTPVVSPRTIEEYQMSLPGYLKRVQGSGRVSPGVAQAALAATIARQGPYTYAWSEAMRGYAPSSFETRLAFYRELDTLLGVSGIVVDNTLDEYLRSKDSEVQDEASRLVKSIPNYFPKHDDIPEHDAYHRLLIVQRRQGHEPHSPLEVPYWFLTCDRKLELYDRHTRFKFGNPKFPFCILSSQWMQLLSPFAALLPDFHEVQAANLDSSLFALFNAPSQDVIASMLDGMRLGSDFPPEVSAKLVLKKHFVDEFEMATGENIKKQLLDDAVLELTQETEGLNIELTTKIKDLEVQGEKLASEKLQLQKDLSDVQRDIASYRKETGDALRQKADILGEFERKLKDAEERLDRLHRENEAVSGRLESQHKLLTSELGKVISRRDDAVQKLTDTQKKVKQVIDRLDWRSKVFVTIVIWLVAVVILVLFRPWDYKTSVVYLTSFILVLGDIFNQGVFYNTLVQKRILLGATMIIDFFGFVLSFTFFLGLSSQAALDTSVALLAGAATVLGGFYAMVIYFESHKSNSP